jgi:glycosyltransferase involved in cell wall biosynthesis
MININSNINIIILICTIDEGIEKVEAVLLREQPGVQYLVSQQYTDKKFLPIPISLQLRPDVSISQIEGKGLSKNRNNALKLADGDLALIADDDVRYLPGAIDLVRETFEKDPSLDIACFKIRTGEGEAEYKKYPKKPTRIRSLFHHHFSSVEVAFRLSSVRARGIKFDERFGLGSERIVWAEENVFIEDCLKAGLNVQFFPSYLVSHPKKPGYRQSIDIELIRNEVRGAYHARILGWKAVPAAFADILFHTPSLLLRGRNPLRLLKERLSAIRYIFSTNSKP